MKAAVINLGCKVNRCESDEFEHLLLSHGYTLDAQGDLDLVIINTCTVTAVAEKKTRKAVRRALKDHPRAHVMVTGCAAHQAPEVYKAMSERVSVIQKWDMEKSLKAYLTRTPAQDIPIRPHYRTRMGVKVQDGCNNACTYCIVHMLRGPEKSTPKEKVALDIASLVSSGIGEIMLTGINLARYNDRGLDMAGLLTYLFLQEQAGLLPASVEPVDNSDAQHLRWRLRLSSMEPDDVTDELIQLVSESHGKVCRHFHLPLQAGSDKVLSDMERHYTLFDYAQLVDSIRRSIPSISLSTDVIVGFPGETEQEFLETVAFCKTCAFSKMHVFPYSPRAGTKAAARTDHIREEEKIERARYLRAVADELRQRDRDARAHTKELAVVESDRDATTESYHYVQTPDGASVGELVEVMM